MTEELFCSPPSRVTGGVSPTRSATRHLRRHPRRMTCARKDLPGVPSSPSRRDGQDGLFAIVAGRGSRTVRARVDIRRSSAKTHLRHRLHDSSMGYDGKHPAASVVGAIGEGQSGDIAMGVDAGARRRSRARRDQGMNVRVRPTPSNETRHVCAGPNLLRALRSPARRPTELARRRASCRSCGPTGKSSPASSVRGRARSPRTRHRVVVSSQHVGRGGRTRSCTRGSWRR
jgi:hypothetical protein